MATGENADLIGHPRLWGIANAMSYLDAAAVALQTSARYSLADYPAVAALEALAARITLVQANLQTLTPLLRAHVAQKERR